MEEAVRLNADAAEPASAEAHEASLPRCEHVLELLLTHRGNPSAEVERVLADDAQSVFGHCLRAALIVCADGAPARSSRSQQRRQLSIVRACSSGGSQHRPVLDLKRGVWSL